MALSNNEKQCILFFLGWSGKTIQENSQLYNSVVDDRLNNLLPFHEKKIRQQLTRLTEIDEKIECALDRCAALEIDGIKTNPQEVECLRRERNIQIRQLSFALDIARLDSGHGNICVVN